MAARWTFLGASLGALLLGLVLAGSAAFAQASKPVGPGSRDTAGQGTATKTPQPAPATTAERAAAERAAADGDTADGDTADGARATPATQPPGPLPLPDNLPDPARFVVVALHDEVSLGMAAFVERVLDDAGAGDVLILDINTFGGRVDAAVIIRDALLAARQKQITTAAYIHPRAISAGALISFATDIIIVAPGATMGAATPVTVQGGEMAPVEEKTVSYMRQEMRATAEARGRNGDIAEAMVDADREVPGLNKSGKLLTLDGKQALEWGIASVEAETLDIAIATLGYGDDGRHYTLETVSWSWAEKLAAFLTSSVLSGLLMSIGMLGIMIGLYTGGSPTPLIAGGICLSLFFFGHHVVNLAGFEEVLIFALGVILVFVELLTPGHIVPGVLGILFIIGALIMGLVNFDQVPIAVQWQEGWITRALAVVFGSIAVTTALSYAGFRTLSETGLARRLLLDAKVTARAHDETAEQHQQVIGQIGTAQSDLRPAGKVKIGHQRFDAVAERGFVPAGTRVKVLGSRGFSVVVAQVRDTPTTSPEAADIPASAEPSRDQELPS